MGLKEYKKGNVVMKKKITSIPGHVMGENRFWELIDMAKWTHVNYKKVKMMYVKTISLEEGKKFHSMFLQAINMLDMVAGEKIKNVGDDSYNDLLCHIVGMGRDSFYKHVNDFALIQERANDENYKECFAYCIPCEDDYGKNNMYSIKHIIKMAKDSQKEIDRIRKMDNREISWLTPINQELSMIDMLMENFLNNRTKEGLEELAKAKWVHKACKKIDKFFQKNRMELPRKFTEELADGSNFNGMCTAIIDNTVYDAKDVLYFMS